MPKAKPISLHPLSFDEAIHYALKSKTKTKTKNKTSKKQPDKKKI